MTLLSRTLARCGQIVTKTIQFNYGKTKQKSVAEGRCIALGILRVRTGKRRCRYQWSHANGNLLFRSCNQINLCHRSVVGLIGGVKAYNRFSSGDPNTSRTAASWFGAYIFLIAATIRRSFFRQSNVLWVIMASMKALEEHWVKGLRHNTCSFSQAACSAAHRYMKSIPKPESSSTKFELFGGRFEAFGWHFRHSL